MWKVKVAKSVLNIVDGNFKREELSFTLEFELAREVSMFMDNFVVHSNEDVAFTVWYEKDGENDEV